MPSQEDPCTLLKGLLTSQHLAVLSTEMHGQPYSNLIAFAATEDCRRIVFITNRVTRKYGNLSEDPHVSLLIDSRTHSVEDFSRAMAVTVLGKAIEMDGDERAQGVKVFLEKQPHLESFALSPSMAVFKVDIETCYLVSNFQRVTTIDVRSW